MELSSLYIDSKGRLCIDGFLYIQQVVGILDPGEYNRLFYFGFITKSTGKLLPEWER